MIRITPRQAALAVLVALTTSLLSRRAALVSPSIIVGRKALLRLGGLGLAALATAGWKSRLPVTRRSSGAPSTAAPCVLSPEQTEGPYYIAKEKVRSNITDRRPGTPLTLRLSVVDAATCTPIKGAVVDIWHCDAAGAYSGFESASAGGGPGGNAGPTDKDTFLRGIQQTGSQGRCAFQTIYPGWYRGRTVHIHVKVYAGGAAIHTGQLYFPDSLTDHVYQAAPYKARASARDTRNSADGIYQNGGPQSTLALKRASTGGYLATITLGVRRS